MTITLELPPDLERQLQNAARLQGKDVPTFLLDSARLRLRSDVLSERETELFQRLQTLFPSEQSREFRTLRDKSDAGTLTEQERETFLALIEQRELQNAERLEIVGELARLRGISLRDMMAQLGIRPE